MAKKRFVRSQNGAYSKLADKSEYINSGSIIFQEDEKIITAWGHDYLGTDTIKENELSVTVGTDTATINLLEGTNGGAKSVVDSVNIKAGNDIDVTVSGDDITISHETINTTFIPNGAPSTVTATEVDFGGEIPLVSLAEVDNGHVTKLEFKKYKLPTLPEFPEVPEYDIKTQSSTTNAKVVLTKDNSVDSTVIISGSDNVTVTSDANGNVSIVSKDEKTTLSGHYTPTANTASELNTTDATNKGGLTAGESEVITGFKIERDEKGHVVGVVAEKGTLPEGLKIDDVEIGNGKVSLQIAGVEDTSFTLNQTGNATFNIPSASNNGYGVVKTGYQTSGKNYAVNLDTNGNAYVNVDWKNDDTKCTSLNITAKTATTPTTDTVDVLTGGISASGNGTSLAGEVATFSVPTKKYVDSAIENGIKDLGSVLEFKGSVNSSADVPTASATTKGDVYLVSTAFDNYEVGDLLICNGTQWIAVNANWTATDGKAQLEWGQTTTLATIGGVTIDATLPSNPNTNYYHTRKYDTGLQITEGTGVEDMYVPEAGATEYGVIKTGFTQDPTNKNYAVQLDENGHAYVSVDWDDTKYEAGTGLTLNGTTFNHSNSITAGTAQGGSGTLTHGGTFTVPTVTYDAQGHITATGTTTYTLPGDNNTDTKVKNTESTSKVFILGQTTQGGDAAEAYTNASVYMQSGKLYSEGYEVINSSDWEWEILS